MIIGVLDAAWSSGSRGQVIGLVAAPMAVVALHVIPPSLLTSSASDGAAVVSTGPSRGGTPSGDVMVEVAAPADPTLLAGAAPTAMRAALALLERLAPEGSNLTPHKVIVGTAGAVDMTFLVLGRPFHATLSVDEDGDAVVALVDRATGRWHLLDVDPQSDEWAQDLTRFLAEPDAAFA